MKSNELKIVSGGQTGVDRGALQAAMDLGLEWGGWAPKGWRADGDGIFGVAPGQSAVFYGDGGEILCGGTIAPCRAAL